MKSAECHGFSILRYLSRAFGESGSSQDPPSYQGVALGGIGTGALQSLMLTPIELVKIRLQLQDRACANSHELYSQHNGPMSVAKAYFKEKD